MKESRNYIYQESTLSLCSTCDKRVPAKIIKENNSIYLLKTCDEHGIHKELLEEDANYHSLKRKFDKPGTYSKPQTTLEKGCPHDCGLCPEHDQHTCIALVEITNQCNLNCPVCFANSGNAEHLSLDTINNIGIGV